ncbi:MAG: Histidine kinase-, DNA gyrase B-, and HSP90-like ATPase [Candidatus Nitrotoga sp. SPKER]|nr:MAG: Histidine kinase-, DNA gyrase B-, and HSP90-like ATPase [Candidatus Nitrotoga sp. SPKER]
MNDYEQSPLWGKAFTHCNDGFDNQRDILAQAYRDFRARVALLLQKIQSELPSLTLHDITHIYALWHIASEIAGPNYPLNPAEALVLGGAFLLHDAAHCRAAFSGGIDELRQTTEWRDAAAQRQHDPDQLVAGSEAFQGVLFDTLRVLHPKQARRLAFTSWLDKPSGTSLHLFPHNELREAYGHLIGEIAQSHWSNPHELEPFARRIISAPAYLAPANWTVNMLKVAVLLRVADAAHIDAKRAPRLLLAMNQPQGISREHWMFQARLNQPHCNHEGKELLFTGSPFPPSEQDAWWLAYDAACLVDHELSAAHHLLRDHQLDQLAAHEVAGIRTPEAFSNHVPTDGWHPVNASLHISDVKSVVERFGGTKLYGDKPYLALRELLQNARDAVFACRAIDGLEKSEGCIEVELEERDGEDWLHVTDTGIGMSRYVLTQVLLDFGRSLWRDSSLRSEWPGLAASSFDAIGRFGIGFFAIFMLGDHVKVVTRRYDAHPNEPETQWVLEFPKGLALRSTLRPPLSNEVLRRPGTRISVHLKDKAALLRVTQTWFSIDSGAKREEVFFSLSQIVGAVAPALEVDVWTREGLNQKIKTISAGDWRRLDSVQLLERLMPILSPNFFSRDKWYLSAIQPVAANITPMVDQDNKIIGRCTVHGATSYLGEAAITVGGLFGGVISNLSGILVGEQLDRLDRSVAIPANILKTWADDQITLLQHQGALTLNSSRILLNLGACKEDVFIISHGHIPLTTRMFRELVSQLDELWVLDEREINYKSDRDDVLKPEFENHLKLDSKVFLLDRSIVKNGFITESVWPTQIFSNTLRFPVEIVEQLLNEIWRDGEQEELDDIVIGTVLGTPITRTVTIFRHQ